MKHKRFFSILLATILFILSLTSCEPEFVQNEQVEYQTAIDSFFDALDNRNKGDIKKLFSKNVVSNDADLDEQIDKLFSVYSDGKTEIKFDGILGGEYDSEDGMQKATVFSTFPVVNNDIFYWFYIELIYQDDFSEDNIGINRVCFYTADEQCIAFKEGDDIPTDIGISIFAERKLENEVRCINMMALEFTPIERDITLAEAENFLKNNNKFPEFAAKFGNPNAKDSSETYYYEFTDDSGKTVYLEIYAENEIIIYSNLFDSFAFIRPIIEE